MKIIRNKYYENDKSQVLYLVTQSKPYFSYKINAVLFNETMLFEYLRLFYAMDLVKFFFSKTNIFYSNYLIKILKL